MPEAELPLEPEKKFKPAPTAPNWVQVGGGILGAIIIGLQSFNLHQTGAVYDNGLYRTTQLERLIDISVKSDEALKNQMVMIRDDTTILQKQTEILETITKAIEDRKELLDQQLKDLRERQAQDAQELRERQDRQGERQDRQGYRQDYQDQIEKQEQEKTSPHPSVSPPPP